MQTQNIINNNNSFQIPISTPKKSFQQQQNENNKENEYQYFAVGLINNNYQQQQPPSTPTCSSTTSPKSPLSPLSPQPMVLSPPKNNVNSNCINSQQPMVLSPPKNLQLITQPPSLMISMNTSTMMPPPPPPQVSTSNSTLMPPPTMIPTKRMSVFETISRAQQQNGIATVHYLVPAGPLIPTDQLSNSQSTPSFNNQRNKTMRRSIKEDSEAFFNDRKREDRKSITIQRQTSKRDLTIHLSRQKSELDVRAELEQKNQVEREKKRVEAIKEILTSEQTYFNHLTTIVENYLLPLRRDYTTPEEVKHIVSIFSNIENIREVNQTILTQFKCRLGGPAPITSNDIVSDLFLTIVPSLHAYTEYYVNWYRSLHNLDQWIAKCKKFKKFIEDRSQCSTMGLKSLLIMPCQRIPRYSLLIEAIYKFTLPDHPDYKPLQQALEKMKSLTELINERIRDSEKVQLVTNVRFKFDDSIGFLDEIHRRLVKEISTIQLLPFKSIGAMSNYENDDDDSTDEEDYGSNNLSTLLVSSATAPNLQSQSSNLNNTDPNNQSIDQLSLNDTSFNNSNNNISILNSKTPKKKKKTISRSQSGMHLKKFIPSECTLYLFNDRFVIGVPSIHYNNKLTALLKCPIATTFFKEYPTAPTKFSVHHNNGSYLFNAPSKEVKDEWLRECNDCIQKLLTAEPDLKEKRDRVMLVGSDEEGWYAFSPSESELIQNSSNINTNNNNFNNFNNSNNNNSISNSFINFSNNNNNNSKLQQQITETQIFTPKKRKSVIGKFKSALLMSPKNQNVKRSSSFVLNSFENNLN
eukprot:gene5314-6619_t